MVATGVQIPVDALLSIPTDAEAWLRVTLEIECVRHAWI